MDLLYKFISDRFSINFNDKFFWSKENWERNFFDNINLLREWLDWCCSIQRSFVVVSGMTVYAYMFSRKPNQTKRKNYSYTCLWREHITWVFIFIKITEILLFNTDEIMNEITFWWNINHAITSNISYQTRRSSQFYLILSY